MGAFRKRLDPNASLRILIENLRAGAWHLEHGKDNAGVSRESLAACMLSAAKGLGVAMDIAAHADAQVAEARKMATDLYSWEPIEAEKVVPVDHLSPVVRWHGPRRDMPKDFVEVSNESGVSVEDWKRFLAILPAEVKP